MPHGEDTLSGSFDSSSVAMRSFGVAQEDRGIGLGGYLFASLTQKISAITKAWGLAVAYYESEKGSLVFHPAAFCEQVEVRESANT
jgi:hypothetical protein